MKILYITHSEKTEDGWGRYSHDIIGGVRKMLKDDVRVISADDLTLQIINLPRFYLVNPIKIFQSSRKIQKFIDEYEPDIIHILVEPYINILPFISLNKNTRVFLTLHGTYSFIPSLFNRYSLKRFISGSILLPLALKRINKIIAVSDYTKNYFTSSYREYFGSDFIGSIVVVSNGINLNNFKIPVKNVNKNTCKNILFVGAVKYRKGILETLKVLYRYSEKYDKNKNFSYIIAGDNSNDSYMKDVNNEISRLNLQNQVVIKGKVSNEELSELYSKADLFILLSTQKGQSFEGFGLVYLEANLYGVPTIGTKESGASDAINEGISGYLVDYNDVDYVADKIHEVFCGSIDKDNCKKWAESQNIENKIGQLVSLYRE